jgi:membrane protease subunit HflK
MAWNEPGNKGNDNDPWGSGGGGRGGDQGPPDLDEVLRKLNKRLSSLFGGKGGSGGKGSGSGSTAGLAGIIIIVAAIAWAAGGFYTVDEAERGVVMRFGELRPDVVMPGLRWNPPLIDTVEKVNVSRVNTRSYSNDMLTTDENIVTVAVSTQYIVEDPVSFAIQVRDPQLGLDQAIESAVRHVVGGTTMDQVLTQGRAQVAAEIRERAQEYMQAYGTGILVTQVNVENAQPPEAVQAAFDDVIRAREDEQRAQNQALAYANQVIPEARGEAQRIIEQSNAYRDEVINRAEGEASRFEQLLVEYQQAPAVTRERLYIDAIEGVLANASKVLIDAESSNNMMYLPLDRLMQQSGDNQLGSNGTSSRLILNDQQVRQIADELLSQLNAQSSQDRSRILQSTRRP